MKLIAKNRRAYFDYDIEDTLQAGIVLDGHEVKSVRANHVSLKGSFATIKDGEVWVHNVHINPYEFSAKARSGDYSPTRPRKLLITKREFSTIADSNKAGRTLVPLAVLAGRFIKIELGIAKGKKKFDKRQAIKNRDESRAIAKAAKNID